jgi:hypothetical protein
MSPPQHLLHFRRGNRQFQRIYIACENCRKKEARCDLGGSSQDLYAFSGPPCARCRQERRECIFSKERCPPERRKPKAVATSFGGKCLGAQELIEGLNQ